MSIGKPKNNEKARIRKDERLARLSYDELIIVQSQVTEELEARWDAYYAIVEAGETLDPHSGMAKMVPAPLRASGEAGRNETKPQAGKLGKSKGNKRKPP